jgi:hypothetical protein
MYDSCLSNCIKIVSWDWKDKVRRKDIYQGHVVRHSMHLNRNNNEQRLVEIAAAKNMVLFSTCFPHKEIHKQTWRFPDGKTNKKNHHILIDKINASSMLDAKTCRGASSDSDHYLVIGKYSCKITYSKYEPNRTTRRIHIDALRETSMVRRFQQQLE